MEKKYVQRRDIPGPLSSIGGKYILLGVQNRELTLISLLPLKIEERKRMTAKQYEHLPKSPYCIWEGVKARIFHP